MGALAVTVLPAAVGLALLGLARPLERRLGAEAAATAGARAALAAAVLAGLLLWQMFQREAPSALRFAWVHVGRTTKIDWLVLADPLALLLGGVALVGLLLLPVAALGWGSGGAARAPARIALASGAALMLATAGSLWQAGLAVALAGMSCRTWPDVQEPSDMPGRAWSMDLVALGLATAGLAWLVGAGDLELATLERSAFGHDGSSLVVTRVGGPFGGLSPAAVAGAAALAAALAWVAAWPRLLARAWADGPAAGAAAWLVLPALPLVLARTTTPLALSPTLLALLTALAAGAAAWAGWRAARAASARACVAAIGQVVLALATAAVGVGDPVAAAILLATGAAGLSAVTLALACGSRARVAVVAIAGLGLLPALGGVLAGLWGRLSAWTSGINVVAPLLALLALAGAAAGLRRVLSGRSEGTGWAAPEVSPLVVGVAGALALGGAAIGLAPLSERLGASFLATKLLAGPYALGPRPSGVVMAPWFGALLAGSAVAVGVVLWTRARPAGPRGPAPARWALARPLAAVEAGLRRLALWPGDERVVTAPRGRAPQAALLGLAAASLAIVGSVFCNPDVTVLGPTRVHPVDVGGLDPAMLGARRAAPAAGPADAAGGTGEGEAAEGSGVGAEGDGAGSGPGLVEGAGAGPGPGLVEGAGAGPGPDLVEGAGAGPGPGLVDGAGAAAGPVEGPGKVGVGASVVEGAGPKGQVPGDSRPEGGP